jgi:hypothetical protein
MGNDAFTRKWENMAKIMEAHGRVKMSREKGGGRK